MPLLTLGQAVAAKVPLIVWCAEMEVVLPARGIIGGCLTHRAIPRTSSFGQSRSTPVVIRSAGTGYYRGAGSRRFVIVPRQPDKERPNGNHAD